MSHDPPTTRRPSAGPRPASRREFLRLVSLSGASLLLRFDQRPAADLPFRPSLWIAVHPDSTVELTAMRLEMGQGIRTTLAVLAGEELGVEPSRIRVRLPLSTEIPDEARILNTGGSMSTTTLWAPIRETAAAAREMLVGAAAERWGVDPGECAAVDAAVEHAASGRRLPFGALVAAAGRRPVPDRPRRKDPSEYRWIGRPVRRHEGPEIVRGEARFSCDVRLPGLRYAVLARSPVPRAERRGLVAEAALAVDGVERVVPLGDKVAVVAHDTWSALQGREALRVDWGPTEHDDFSSSGFDEALGRALRQPLDERYSGQRPGGSAVLTRAEGAPIESAFPRPPEIDAEFRTPFQAHVPMEPWNATARVSDGLCEVWCGTQSPHRIVRELARRFGLPTDRVVVHLHAMGGGFGAREHAVYAVEAAVLAREIGQPVQVFWSRDDDLRNALLHPGSRHRIRVWLDRDGRLGGWAHRVASPAVEKQWEMGDGKVPYAEAAGAWNLPYAPASLRVEYADPPQPFPLGFWRGVHFNFNTLVVECVIDEAARLAGRDPVEYRLAHLADEVRALGAKRPFQVARLRPVLALAAERGGWGEPLPPGRGRGIAALVFDGRSAAATVAEVTVEGRAWKVDRLVCAMDCGRVVNPLGLESNAQGALAWGLSALESEITFQNGRVVQQNHLDYPILRLPRMPEVEIHTVPSEAPPSGSGEVPAPTVAPAVLNAIADATGRRLRRLPILPEDLA